MHFIYSKFIFRYFVVFFPLSIGNFNVNLTKIIRPLLRNQRTNSFPRSCAFFINIAFVEKYKLINLSTTCFAKSATDKLYLGRMSRLAIPSKLSVSASLWFFEPHVLMYVASKQRISRDQSNRYRDHMAINYVCIANMLLMSLKIGIAAKTELFKRGKQDCQHFLFNDKIVNISFKISLVIVAS